MADLDSLKSSLLVGLTGLDSQGGETNPLVVNPDGSINVLQVAGENIKVSSNDQTTGYLQQKIIGTTGKITTSVQDEGNDEKLVINTGSNIFDKTIDTATQVVNTPSGNISSTNVQAAINELDSEKAKLVGGNVFSGDQSITGKVGIGVLTPGHEIEIQSVSPEVLIKGTSSTGIAFIDVRNDTSNYTEIGTYGSTQSSTSFGQSMANSSFIFSSASKLITGTFGTSPLIFGTNSLERVRITDTGQLSIGTATPNSSAIVDITSTTSGFLMPRMTSTQRNAITTPVNGLLVYDSTDTQFYYYTGSQWVSITSLTQLNTKADKTITISAGTGLTGGGDLSANRTLSIANTAVTAASYGSATQVPTYTVNAQGQITAAANTSIQISESQVTNLTTDLTNKQPLDGDLTAIAGLTTNGLITRTAADTMMTRTITGSASNISVSNGDGISGNPTIDLINAGTAGTYGSAKQIPVFTTDTKGRVTSVTNTPINLTTFSNSSTGTVSTSSTSFQASGVSITPNIAGSYILIAHTEILCATSGVSNNTQATLSKNGTALGDTTQDLYIDTSGISLASFGISGNIAMVSLVTANGTTDTFDIYYRRVNGSNVTIGSRRILAIRYA